MKKKLPFEECFIDKTGGNIKIKQSDYLEFGVFPIIDQGKKFIGGYTNDRNKIVKCKIPCIVYGDHSRNVKYLDTDFAIGADGVKLLETTDLITPKFGYYFLQTVQLPEAGYDRSFKYLKRIEVPILPITEQNKIVSILDKASALITKREETIQSLDKLLRATFLDMFGDPVFNKKKWAIVPLSEIINKIDAGWSPVCEEIPRLRDNQFAVLKQGAVSKRFFDSKQNKLLPEDLPIKKKVLANKGDLLFSRKNTGEMVGATAYVFEEYQNLLLPDTIFNLRYDKSKVSGVYLYYLFNDLNFRKTIQKLKNGAAASMPNISQENLMGHEIPLPSINLQLKFESLVLKVYTGKLKLSNSLIKLELLQNSIFQKSFKGELSFNIDAELDSLVNAIDLQKKENDLSKIAGDEVFLKRLIDKLNTQEFKEKDQYDKAKHGIFQLLKEGKKVTQQYNEQAKSIQLALL